MSKRKISSYFRHESDTDETIDKVEEKTENKFHEEKNDARSFKNSQFPDEMVEWTQVVKVRKMLEST